ncbi:MAG: hypothetical protein A3H28_02400 [Acidobacteria bacterium RIFCSPLOWO2_02_FULL_61_28]|nr:MAG: hypothetical protein A3H28_02400 [Acidobacteria bacterium RIFCSPLOWO2_02_FULL_61_28]
MPKRVVGVVLAGVVFAFAPVLLAQTPPQPRTAAAPRTASAAAAQPAAPRDLSGFWGNYTPRSEREAPAEGARRAEEAVLTPWAAEHFKALVEANKLGTQVRDLLDPHIVACAPPGAPRVTAQGRPFRIIQLPAEIIMIFEWGHWVRNIWTDGRGHPKDVDPGWMGHSIGHWDGDTLVVDTVGFNDHILIDRNGAHPGSETLRMVERIRMLDQNTLRIDTTYEDPKIYVKPWTKQLTFSRDPQGGPLLEWVDCEDRITRDLKADPCKPEPRWELEVACRQREEKRPAGRNQNEPSAY